MRRRHSEVDPGRTVDTRLLGASLRLGVATVPHALAIYVVSAGDRILVERELGLSSVARYQVAYLVGALGLTVAGAFTIDGRGAAFVEGIDGDHSNVIGVSLPLLRQMCAALGVRWIDLWALPT